MSSGVMPPASISSTWLAVIRIPRIVGSPPQTSGMIVIRSIGMAAFYSTGLVRQPDLRYTSEYFLCLAGNGFPRSELLVGSFEDFSCVLDAPRRSSKLRGSHSL